MKKILTIILASCVIIAFIALLIVMAEWIIPMTLSHGHTTGGTQDKDIKDTVDAVVNQDIRDYINMLLAGAAILFTVIGYIVGLLGKQYLDKSVEESYNRVALEQRIITLMYQLEKVDTDATRTSQTAADLKKAIGEILKSDNDHAKSLADTCISIYYTVKRRDSDVIELCQPYEDTPLTLSYKSWFYYAISNMNLFQNSFSPHIKERAITGCTNSLECLPGFGSAYAVMCLVYTIEYRQYETEGNTSKMETIKNQISGVLDEVIRNKSYNSVSSYEMFNYLIIDTHPQYVKDAVAKIDELFPEKIKKVEELYVTYKSIMRIA